MTSVPVNPDNSNNHPPPEAWLPVHAAARRFVAPVQAFLSLESASGILLMVAAAAAMIWANSPWSASYDALWSTELTIGLGPYSFERDLRFWVNDGLMAVFFFVVGLEIRREIHRGELSSLKRAGLPLVAAFGGMVAPALVYFSLNSEGEASAGWGVPMATDIAFAVGVLALLGSRVPSSLRILLLAVAVIDDVGAILVIAIFYSSGITVTGSLIAVLGLLLLFCWRWVGVRSPWAYVPPAVVLWAGLYTAGIHPTLAGVILGLLTPVTPWLGRRGLASRITEALPALQNAGATEHDVLRTIEVLDSAQRESVSFVERLQHTLHPYVAFLVMPVFALANAGVAISPRALSGDSVSVLAGVSLGLLFGKPLGILLFSWLGVRTGLAAMPEDLSWRHMTVLGLVAGIGFTMSLFIAQLAFPGSALLESAKLGILAASSVAGVAGLASGLMAFRKTQV